MIVDQDSKPAQLLRRSDNGAVRQEFGQHQGNMRMLLRKTLQICLSVVALLVLVLGIVTAVMPDAWAQGTGWWRPAANQRLALHWVLGDPLDVNSPLEMGLRDFNGRFLPEPDVYSIDGEMNTAETVSHLHAKGKKVICYIDAGVYETYRGDAYKFQVLSPRIWGNPDDGWNDSYWLDVRRVSEPEPIMKARMQMCKDKASTPSSLTRSTAGKTTPAFGSPIKIS